ncbi:putative IQ motif, EF-hand binding, CG-1 DNA-binding domain, immunoglobulin-like protein [Plasmopara halstedii]
MHSGNSIQSRAAFLRHAATQRWLVKDELVFLLIHYRVVGVPISCSRQTRSPSTFCCRAIAQELILTQLRWFIGGTLLFYNTLKLSDYKNDGWHWQKRKDKGERVREDRAKLVINRDVVILGTYVHSAEIPTFHRRIYSLRESKESIVLVHYFDEVNKVYETCRPSLLLKSSLHSTSLESTQSQRVAKPCTSTIDVIPHLRQSSLPESSLNAARHDDNYSTSYQVYSPYIDDADLLLSNNVVTDGLVNFFSEDDPFYDMSILLSPEKYADSSGQQTFEQVEISDFSPDWDFENGGAKLLICLAASLPEIAAQEPAAIFVQFGTERVHAEKISDTVLRCTAPRSKKLGSVDMFVCHWHEPQECIQLSHKKQFTYRNSCHVSPLFTGSITNKSKEGFYDASDLSSSCSAHAGKRVRSPSHLSRSMSVKHSNERCAGSNKNLSTFVESDLDERQCKIRVVERLSEFHHAIYINSASEVPLPSATTSIYSKDDETGKSEEDLSLRNIVLTSDSSTTQASYDVPTQQRTPIIASTESAISSTSSSDTFIALDDRAIEALSDHELEQLSDELLERVVRQLVTVAHTSEELLEELNSLDETGLSLLHYVSFYNYSQLVPVLIAHGAHINQQSTQGQTALHLAAGCGHTNVVDVLLQSGADLQCRDFDGLTAADRAEKSGHADVAAKLNHQIENEAFSLPCDPVDTFYCSHGSPMDLDNDLTPYHDAGDLGLLAEIDFVHAAHPSQSSIANCCECQHDTTSLSKATSYVGENQEHNRKFLLGAFSTMSLHDKCALSLTISRESGSHVARRRDNSVGDENFLSPCSSSTGTSVGFGSSPASMVGMDASLAGGRLMLSGNENDSDVQSVIAEDEESLNKLQAAMELMGPEEIQSLEDEVKVLQHGIRAWLLKRNCRNMRETTIQLREATQSIADQQKQREAAELEAFMTNELSDRERAAVTVQAATRTMLARRSFLQAKHVAIKFQAATRGILCRKNFARMKTQALASLVIQRNVREWWNKQPAATRPNTIEHDINDEFENFHEKGNFNLYVQSES